MDVSALGIIEIDETPPPLDLTPVDIEALAETLLQYHAEFAPRSCTRSQRIMR